MEENLDLDGFTAPIDAGDLLDFEKGDSKGEPVSFRLNPKLLHTIDVLIQHGRETSGMPKTRSDFIRLCCTRHLKRLMAMGIPKDWDSVPLLRALKEEMEIGQFADGMQSRVDTLKRSLSQVRATANSHIADLEFDLAADVIGRYFAMVEKYRTNDLLLSARLIKQMYRDDVFITAVSQLNKRGYELIMPVLEESG